jgi:site-specific recombinase XerD
VRAFLCAHCATGGIRLTKLTPADVVRFVTAYTTGWAPASQRVVGDGLRSYFRFRALRGEHTAALAAAIPRVALWQGARLPQGLTAAEVTRLLAAFDRTSATGKRDYAITHCVVDLGLRTTEVARLRLEDIDWRTGRVSVRGKGHRVDVLPLPPTTGHAIVDYLRQGRPQTNSRALFLRHRPPRETPATVEVVRGLVRRAAQRGGVAPCLYGPQVLRHTLAERLVLRGTPLEQIADLLRHRSLDTTTIYAKVDLPALRRVALPWPGRRP